MSDKASNASDENFGINTQIQLTGILFKKPVGHHSNKWSKRFFIVKDSFLLYYPESEKRMYEKWQHFNIHPKGAIPLGSCCVVESTSEPTQKYCITIKSDYYAKGGIMLATDTQYEMEKWLRVLQAASRITSQSTEMGELIIRELENQGLQLNKERQKYLEKFQEETVALYDQISKNEELARINSLLEDEKRRLETMIQDIRLERQRLQEELEDTTRAMQLVEADREGLSANTEALSLALQDLEKEKAAMLLGVQNTKESEEQLKEIEEETRLLLSEKKELENRFDQNELRAKVLEEEKELITKQSHHLSSTLNDLMCQKAMDSDSEIREEVVGRVEVEKRIQLAKSTLDRLEGSLEIHPSVKDSIMPDVQKLKSFFEQVAQECRMDADLPVIMKNAVYARKAMVKKAQDKELEETRAKKARSLGLFSNDGPCTLKRSLSTYISNRSLQPPPSIGLRRTCSTRIPAITTNKSHHSTDLLVIDGETVKLRQPLLQVPEEDKG